MYETFISTRNTSLFNYVYVVKAEGELFQTAGVNMVIRVPTVHKRLRLFLYNQWVGWVFLLLSKRCFNSTACVCWSTEPTTWLQQSCAQTRSTRDLTGLTSKVRSLFSIFNRFVHFITGVITFSAIPPPPHPPLFFCLANPRVQFFYYLS